MSMFRVLSASPLLTIQDAGRHGALAFGLCASGPMDQVAYGALDNVLSSVATTGLEFAAGKFELECVKGASAFAWSGAGYSCHLNDQMIEAQTLNELASGDKLRFEPVGDGNFAYLRFSHDIEVPSVLGSRATNLVAKIGGLDGRNLKAGDELGVNDLSGNWRRPTNHKTVGVRYRTKTCEPFQFVWGLHENLFENDMRQAFCEHSFKISHSISRMGFRLIDRARVFAGFEQLNLVSDPVVAGDIQILGDGTPIVLMRDHQPTGGYPRIGTLLQSEISRFAQMPPGKEVRFEPISVERAHQEQKSRS